MITDIATYNLKQTNYNRMTYNYKWSTLKLLIILDHFSKKNIYESTIMLLGIVILNFKITPFMQVLLTFT